MVASMFYVGILVIPFSFSVSWLLSYSIDCLLNKDGCFFTSVIHEETV